MGQLKKTSFRYFFCFAVGVITGIIIGTAALSIIVSYRIDTYHKKITHLETDIQDKNARLEKLEQSINTQKYILKDIEIILLFNEGEQENEAEEVDEIEKIEIEKNIKEKYALLLGKEVKNIDADMIAEIIDKRIFKIEDREYKLHVSRLVLTDILKIWVSVTIF